MLIYRFMFILINIHYKMYMFTKLASLTLVIRKKWIFNTAVKITFLKKQKMKK